MDFFEYISVMNSVILGLGVTTLLVTTGRILSPWTEERPYWVFYMWIAVLFLLHISLWWALWDLHTADWNFFGFAYSLLGPSVLIVATHVLLARVGGDDTVDLEAHFFGSRRTFFTLTILLQLWVIFMPLVMAGSFQGRVFFRLGWLALLVLGLTSDSRRVHGFVAVGAAVLLVFLMAFIRLLPGMR